MTSNQADNQTRLNEIVEIMKRGDTDVSPYIPEIMALCEAKLQPPELMVLECELKGYNTKVGIQYYTKQPESRFDSGYIGWRGMVGRQWEGRLQVRKPDGTYSDVTHEIGKRRNFFVSETLPEIERLAKLPGDTVEMELPDLTEHIGQQEGGVIVLMCDRARLQKYVETEHQTMISLIRLVTSPEQREKADTRTAKYREERGLPPEQ